MEVVGKLLEIIGIVLMIFVDKQTLISSCILFTYSIMIMFQNEKISLNLKQILTFDSRE